MNSSDENATLSPVKQNDVPAAALFPLPAIPSRAAQKLRNDRCDIWLYLAGSTALKTFLQPLGVTAYKFGISGRRDVDDRILDFRRKCYAGIFGAAGDPVGTGLRLPGAHEWFQSPLEPAYMAGAELPPCFSFESDALRLSLPRTIVFEDFDKAVREMLAGRALDAYLVGTKGRARLIEAGLNPAHCLVTDYGLIGKPRRSRAEELYLIRPRQELPGLVEALASLVARLGRGTT